MKLATAQIILGFLTVTVSSIVRFWYLPRIFPNQYSENIDGVIRTVFVNYGSNLSPFYVRFGALIVLGLAILGCGIVQLLKAKQSNPRNVG